MSLRCWRAELQVSANNIDSKSFIKRTYIVLAKVFGVNAWMLSVTYHSATHGYPALAVTLFVRTAPDLELAYGLSDLTQGLSHKDITKTEQILGDVSAALR